MVAACCNTFYYSAFHQAGMAGDISGMNEIRLLWERAGAEWMRGRWLGGTAGTEGGILWIGGDSGSYYYASLAETGILLHDPLYFFRDLFQHHYASAGNLFLENSYWNDLKSMLMIKLLAVCNVVTFKNYFADLSLFNLFFFFGPVAFFRLADELFPGRKRLLILSVFCIPSFLFWCSSIHKDGWVFLAIGLVFYYFHQSVKSGFTLKRGLVILTSLLLLFALRNYVCFLFLPVMLGWWLAARYRGIPPFIVFVMVSVVCLSLFFTSRRISETLDFPAYIVTRQHAFSVIKNHTEIRVPRLLPVAGSFAHYLPTAVDVALFRPHPGEITSFFYYPLLAELYVLLLFGTGGYFFRNKKQVFPVAGWACLFFAAGILLMLGYIVTFSGAIVRYRSLVFPLLITLSAGYLDLQRIRKFFRLRNTTRHNF
jgi:hypothetical protein